MILHRLASAIRHQNWSQIVTEILIVIIGIFLGLQVQAWYDGRAALVEETRTIDYFIADLEKNNAALAARDLFMNNQIANGNLVLEVLSSGELSEEEKGQFEEGLARISFTEPLTAFLNSLNPENLGKIRDIRLRRVLDSFVGYVDRSTVVSLNIKTNIQGSTTYLNGKASFIRHDSGNLIGVYDFGELKNDSKFNTLFVNVLGKIINYQRNSTNMIEQSEIMIAVLKAYQAGETLPEVEFR